MADRMNHGRDYYQPVLFDDFINHTVRKPFWIAPTDVLGRVLLAVQERVFLKSAEDPEDFFDELTAQT
jgi:hypothetical protein